MISDFLGSFLTPLPPISDFPPILKAFYTETLRFLETYPPSLKSDIIYGRPLLVRAIFSKLTGFKSFKSDGFID